MTDTAPLPQAAAVPAAAHGADTPAAAPAASPETGTPATPPPGLRDFYENPAVPVASGDGRSRRQALSLIHI